MTTVSTNIWLMSKTACSQSSKVQSTMHYSGRLYTIMDYVVVGPIYSASINVYALRSFNKDTIALFVGKELNKINIYFNCRSTETSMSEYESVQNCTIINTKGNIDHQERHRFINTKIKKPDNYFLFLFSLCRKMCTLRYTAWRELIHNSRDHSFATLKRYMQPMSL